MCLAVPACITELGGSHPDFAVVEVEGVRREVNIALVAPDGVQVGDWVIVHVGFAMAIIDEAEAIRSLALMRSLGGADSP